MFIPFPCVQLTGIVLRSRTKHNQKTLLRLQSRDSGCRDIRTMAALVHAILPRNKSHIFVSSTDLFPQYRKAKPLNWHDCFYSLRVTHLRNYHSRTRMRHVEVTSLEDAHASRGSDVTRGRARITYYKYY